MSDTSTKRDLPGLKVLLPGVLAATLVAGGLVYAGVRLAPDEGPGGPSHPDEWDPRVLPLVEQVEELRGLDFEHPVHVDFLSVEEFREKVTSDEDDLDEEDREEIEQMSGFLRSVGVVEGDVDLFASMNALTGGGTLGFYSFEDERITVRGTELTWAIRSTLVHELTHALQDQHFDIGSTSTEIDEDEDDNPSSMAFTALIEGDARRIERDWAESLTTRQRQALRASEKAQSDGAEADLDDVPEFMTTLMGAPYALGEGLMASAGTTNARVDRLFEEPPTTEEHLLDPFTLILDEDEQLDVEQPDVEEGEEEVDSSTFGSVGWYLVLAERIPLRQALRAVDGWGGDSFVHVERGSRQCVRVRYVADTPRDLREMHTALRDWVAVAPRHASVRRSGDGLLFESCDPGRRSRVGRLRSEEALDLALARTLLTVQVREDVNATVARCFARGIVEEFTDEELQLEALDAGQQARLERVQRRCL